MQVGGGGGNRTRVRKGSYESFYTFSGKWWVGHRRPSLTLAPRARLRPAQTDCVRFPVDAAEPRSLRFPSGT